MANEEWSQGRLAGAVLSQGAESGDGYIHEYIRACGIEERKAFMGAAQEVASRYPAIEVQSHLNRRYKEGWRLMVMEPHWWYERQVTSGAESITRPLAIVGWYLTFSREAR